MIWFLKREGQNIDILGLNDASESDAIAIAPHLPVGLKALEVTVGNIGDHGVAALAPHLPVGLEVLDLTSIDSQMNMGQAGGEAIAQHMPSHLQVLSLGKCGISASAAVEIVNKLPASLEIFEFYGNETGSALLTRLKERRDELSRIQSISLTKTSDYGSQYYKNVNYLKTIYGKTKEGKEIVHW